MQPDTYPTLTAPSVMGPIRAQFRLQTALPPATLISNVNIIPVIRNGHWVATQHESGEFEVIGGTLEPNEDYRTALEREVMEEAGARLLSFEPFGAFECYSSAPEPYRPHLPHPTFYRVVGFGLIDLVETPPRVERGEAIQHVISAPLSQIVAGFRQQARHDLAELYLLAAELRGEH